MKRCQQVATVLIAAVSLAAGAIDTAQAQGRFGAFGLEAGNAVFMGAWGILEGNDRMAVTLGLGSAREAKGAETSEYLVVAGSFFARSLGKLRIYPSAALALFADCYENSDAAGRCVRGQWLRGQDGGSRIHKRVDGALGTDLFLILAPDRRGLAFSARVYSSGRFTMGFGWTFDR